MKQTWSLSEFTWCPKLPDFILIGWPDDFQVVLLHAEEINSDKTTGPNVIKLEYSLQLRINFSDWLLAIMISSFITSSQIRIKVLIISEVNREY